MCVCVSVCVCVCVYYFIVDFIIITHSLLYVCFHSLGKRLCTICLNSNTGDKVCHVIGCKDSCLLSSRFLNNCRYCQRHSDPKTRCRNCKTRGLADGSVTNLCSICYVLCHKECYVIDCKEPWSGPSYCKKHNDPFTWCSNCKTWGLADGSETNVCSICYALCHKECYVIDCKEPRCGSSYCMHHHDPKTWCRNYKTRGLPDNNASLCLLVVPQRMLCYWLQETSVGLCWKLPQYCAKHRKRETRCARCNVKGLEGGAKTFCLECKESSQKEMEDALGKA